MKWGISMLATPELRSSTSLTSDSALDSTMYEFQTTVQTSWGAADEERQPVVQKPSVCHAQPQPWVPEPALHNAPPGTEFKPFPDSIGMEGFWEVIRELSTPFPTPVHKMLNISALGQRLQSLCPGVLVEETPDIVRMSFAPVALDGDSSLSKLPVHLMCHTEIIHKDNKVHSHIGVARDVTVGRIQTEGFLGEDGTLYGRFTKRGLMSGKRIDWICEDVAKLDPTGQFITIDQHVRDMKGRTATQRMVLRRRPKAAAKVMLKMQPASESGSDRTERSSELSEASSESDE